MKYIFSIILLLFSYTKYKQESSENELNSFNITEFFPYKYKPKLKWITTYQFI